MMLHVRITPETEATLLQQAAAAGEDVSAYAARLLAEAARRRAMDHLLAPVRDAFEQSGMNEDELSDLLEHEKHAMRGERGTNDSNGKAP